MKAALRLGLIYWAVLLLVFALGHRNQVEKEANARLERELQALEAQRRPSSWRSGASSAPSASWPGRRRKGSSP